VETRVYVICEKSFKNQQIAKNPKNSPTIFGTITQLQTCCGDSNYSGIMNRNEPYLICEKH